MPASELPAKRKRTACRLFGGAYGQEIANGAEELALRALRGVHEPRRALRATLVAHGELRRARTRRAARRRPRSLRPAQGRELRRRRIDDPASVLALSAPARRLERERARAGL